ncbi:hypothetical protein MAPG_08496 [Magnaporthiopsis poae ATCC 64411]|uniref:Uncharacterized protein n=1 Tax=Magnaporthiopsis poae (strain ATCC 64411 / 73-15) TaxID=644358 RepID=A0A0C4E7I3_MAGP6|nr:hypothetical protein MAPG_08496 [Magnaporthiopsis poae ATCC 64411]
MAPEPQELKFFLLKRRLPAPESATVLGQIVKNFLSPTSDYTPQSPEKTLTPDIWSSFLLEEQTDHDAHITASSSKDRSFWTRVKAVAAVNAHDAQGGSSEISSPSITVRGLKRESAYLAALKSVPEVRREMLRLCPVGGKAYLVVGTMSFQTAAVKRAGNREVGAGASATVPVGGELAAVIGAELGAERSSSAAWTTGYNVKGAEGKESDGGGQEVFAVACKEISRGLLGLGKDIKLKDRQPEYRGGVHFGSDDSSESDEEEDEDEELPSPADQQNVDSCLFGFSQAV